METPGRTGSHSRNSSPTTGGLPAIQPDFKWDDDFDPNLTGGDGGLYFTGPNTEAVFGAPVPLWTKSPFVSISHLNDNYFNDRDHPTDPRYIQMMVSKDSPGKDAPRELSKLELAIMEDIGYTIAAPIAATPVLAAQQRSDTRWRCASPVFRRPDIRATSRPIWPSLSGPQPRLPAEARVAHHPGVVPHRL